MRMGVRNGRQDTYMGETGGYDGVAVSKVIDVILLKWDLLSEVLEGTY